MGNFSTYFGANPLPTITGGWAYLEIGANLMSISPISNHKIGSDEIDQKKS